MKYIYKLPLWMPWKNRGIDLQQMKDWCFDNCTESWEYDPIGYQLMFRSEKDYNWFLLKWG